MLRSTITNLPLANHHGEGMNVLFADGHCEWFDAKVGASIVAAATMSQRVLVRNNVATTMPANWDH